jgi:hypothetical protein
MQLITPDVFRVCPVGRMSEERGKSSIMRRRSGLMAVSVMEGSCLG